VSFFQSITGGEDDGGAAEEEAGQEVGRKATAYEQHR